MLVADESGYPFPRATLIDFGVARHVSVPDTEPASRYGTPGYQAPELLMTDMRRAEKNHELYAKVDVFALGCTLFFLCVGKELFGATPGDDGADEFGARTKTKARAQLAQEMMDETMEKSGAGGTDVAFESVEEGMVVRRRKNVKNKARDSAAEPDADTNFAAAALARALGRAAERADLESRETEQELDVLMLKSMAEFPGYEPRTPEEVAFVERTYGGAAAAGGAAAPRVSGSVCQPQGDPQTTPRVRVADRRVPGARPRGQTERRGGAQLAGSLGRARRRRVIATSEESSEARM